MNTERHRSVSGLGLAGLVGAAGLLCLTFAAPADAAPRDRRPSHAAHAERGDDRHHAYRDRRPDRRGHAEHGRLHGHAHRPPRVVFEIPRRLHRHHEQEFRSYYRGRAYSRAHGHYHAVYDFPVRTSWGYESRPHHYCEGGLFGGGFVAYSGPRINFGLRF